MDRYLCLIILTIISLGRSVSSKHFDTQPHIIFMVGDDFGWNDIEFHNKDIKTPHMKKLATNGIILNSSYVQQLCTPSRSAFMTGHYPFKNGLQQSVIPNYAPFGLPLQFELLPQALKKLGYSTHLVGKWHLGSCNESYLPFNRGFDSSFGYYSGGEYHYNHDNPLTENSLATWEPGAQMVYDFFNQSDTAISYNGTYSSVAFTAQVQHVLENSQADVPLFLYLPFQLTHSPTEVNEDYLFWYPDEPNKARKSFSAMVTQLDNDIGQIINMLKVYGIYDNSIILFTADNGGELKDGGNNYPLRGGKNTLYEGGTRASAFIHSPLLEHTGYTYDGLIHAVDWYPTFVSLAGGVPDPSLDGHDVWSAVTKNEASPRTEFIYSLFYNENNLTGAIRVGDWKMIFGKAGLPNTQVPPENVTGDYFFVPGGNGLVADIPGYPAYRLYNISADPTESYDVADDNPDVIKKLKERVHDYEQQMVYALFQPPNVPLYKSLTDNLDYLNTNWCEAIEKVTPMY